MSSSIFIVEIGSNAEQGSSNNNTLGLIAIPRAMHKRCCCPPDKLSPLLCNLSFTSFQRAALVNAHSTRSFIFSFDNFSNKRTPNAILS